MEGLVFCNKGIEDIGAICEYSNYDICRQLTLDEAQKMLPQLNIEEK